MPLPRFAKLEPDRQQRLLAAAAHEFAAHGFEAASIQRITDAAGMSKAALYYYFDDKADLFVATVQAAWGALLAEVQNTFDIEAADAAGFWPALRRLHDAMLARFQDEPWLVAAAKLTYNPQAAGTAAPAVLELLAQTNELRRRVMRRGQELGVVRADLPEDLLLALVAATDQAADRWMLERWDVIPEAERAALAGRVFDTVRAIAQPPRET